MNETPTIQYLNTDLDFVCDFDPASLAAEFESHNLVAIVNQGGDGLFYVMCEDSNESEPEPNAKRLLDAVEGLSTGARELWARCITREFNVGYQCGDQPRSFSQGLPNDVLRRIALSGASFRITLYAHRSEAESRVVCVNEPR